MRPPHYLQPNHRTGMPTYCIWVDTETNAEKQADGSERHYLREGQAAFRRRLKGDKWSQPEWLEFTTISAFWDWAESKTAKNKKTYIFAHNWGFDAPVLDAFKQLPARGWEPRGAILDSPPTWIPFVRPKYEPAKGLKRLIYPKGIKTDRAERTIVLMDTLNIWRMSLATLGEYIGCPKLPMPSPDARPEFWKAYNRRDVSIIMQAVMHWVAFLREHDLGNFAMTLAGQAFAAYRHRFMTERIYIDSKPQALELARTALHGGRTECFRIGHYTGEFYLLDVNSMYPYVMRERKYPLKLRGTYKSLSAGKLFDLSQENAVLVECELNTQQPAYGIVHEHKLVFPTGRLVATLTTPEFQHACHLDAVHRVKRAAVYSTGEIFRDYVEYFWTLRAQALAAGNTVEATQLKLMLNSLFGKFGQRGRHWTDVGEAEDDEPGLWNVVNADTGEQTRYRQFGGSLQVLTDKGEAYNSHPAIAAHVTAYGRMMLWALIRLAGRGNVFYCDTDSVLVNRDGYVALKPLTEERQLGALKLEGTFQNIELYGPKDYVFGDKRRTKGVRKDAEWLDANTVRQTQFMGLRGLLAAGQMSAPVVKQVEKHLKREYTKGTVDSDGRVTPLHLSQW